MQVAPRANYIPRAPYSARKESSDMEYLSAIAPLLILMLFGGGIVIVGLTAKGLNNPVATAVGGVYPHYLQAAVLDTIVSGKNINRPDYADGAELLTTILLCIVTLFLTRYTHGYIAIIFLGLASYWGSHELFNRYFSLIDVTFPLLTIFVVYGHGYTVKFLSELRQKLQIKKQFGTYLSPAMVEKLQKNPELLVLGGESRELSIMFTDVRGFTAISEHYGKDVQGLTKIMNRYMTAMTAKIIENQGTLDKYIGDAQMAFWNAPLDDKEHRRNALKTALEMLGDLDDFNYTIASDGVPPFGMGLGINTGSVVVGNMGSSQRFDYTCLGDSVNLASRLEGQSKDYGVKVVLGHNTVQGIDDEFFILELDTIAVKGKKEGVNIYTCLGYNDKLDMYKKDKVKHEHFLADYRARRFDGCLITLESIHSAFGGKMKDYYAMMQKRCEYFAKNDPGKNWDGVYRATSK